MQIFVGADHNGFELRKNILKYLAQAGHDVHDDSNGQLDPQDDYPVFAAKVVSAMRESGNPDAKGILLCGSGQGIMIAANRFKGIRACLGYNTETVRAARNDDDCNVLALPAHTLSEEEAHAIIDTFLQTTFEPIDRYVRRIEEMDAIEG